MKKLIALLLALLMTAGLCLAEETEENAYLTQEEMEMYLDLVVGDAIDAGAEVAQVNPDTGVTTIAFGQNGQLLIADEQLTPTSAALGAVLTSEQEDLRGIRMGQSLLDVLAVYPNDNPALTGTRYDAVLYVNGEKPEATVGFLLRDGQRVTEVTHLVFTWTDDKVFRTGITYTLDQDVVTGIRIFGLDAPVEESDALQQIADAAALQEISEFTPYPLSYRGDDLPPFEAADFSFAGIRFDTLNPQEAEAAFGKAKVDEWMEDSTGEFLRTLQWDGISLVFLYNAQKAFLRVDSLTVNDDVLEGPRAVRIGDTLDGVLYRFRHGDNAALQNAVALYGDGETAPYAVLSYGETTATLTYAASASDGAASVLWQMTFADGQLIHYRMLLR